MSLLLVAAGIADAQTLVDAGSSMRFRANVTAPSIGGVDWAEAGFDDAAWSPGLYGVGYEAGAGANGLLATYVTAGTRSVYTRARFHVEDPSGIVSLALALDYDDGVVAWINGVEVYRSPSMPPGTPLWNAVAASHESSNGVDPGFSSVDVSAEGLPALTEGENVLAVGVWNSSSTSSDLVLVPRLFAGSPSAFVTRGPYLQLGTSSSVVVRWGTDAPTSSEVRFGPAPGPPESVASDPSVGTRHEVTLGGLDPDTEYVYGVGAIGEPLLGGGAGYAFRTAPLPGARRSLRAWVLGDSGTANADACAVRDGYHAFGGGVAPDLWLLLGDNAYSNGTEDEYEAALFNTYPDTLRRAVVWPTLGNHDAGSATSTPPGSETGVYYDLFTLPAAGEAGGVASGTEAYYAFDYGNVHFVVLNSTDVDRTPGSAMLSWLASDLEDTAQDWIVAYWHHPPYSAGSHLSDVSSTLIQMREWVLPVLEAHGVDLVMTGHSHAYERSFLLDGHYGDSTTLTAEMRIDEGDGRFDGTGPYQKPSSGPAPHEGAVYAVAGSSGKLSPGPLDHPVMVTSLLELGSLVLDVEGDRLDGSFVGGEGVVLDRFTLLKNTAVAPEADFVAAPGGGPAPLTVAFEDLSSTNTAAWGWDFGDDGSVDSFEQHPTHVFPPGAHDVRLTVANASGEDAAIRPAVVCASIEPPAVVGLSWESSGTLVWETGPAGVTGYDVIRGDLAGLRAGDFAGSVTGCIADDVPANTALDSDPLPAGSAVYYLVRAASCDVAGSYDGGGAKQVDDRDAALASSAAACS